MFQIIMSEVSHHTHQAVTLQFFETVVRYEKFYHHQPECIPAVLVSNLVIIDSMLLYVTGVSPWSVEMSYVHASWYSVNGESCCKMCK